MSNKETTSTKEMLCNDTASLMEELSDEALTACVGGTGYSSTSLDTLISATVADTISVDSSISVNATYYDPTGSGRTRSDRNIKENFAAVDVQEILASVVKLPIETWNYKEQNPEIRHIGPMAQNFAAAFSVGEDDRHINTVDANGVAIAAIQALYKMLLEKEATIGALRTDLEDLKQQVIESKAQKSVAMPAVAFNRN